MLNFNLIFFIYYEISVGKNILKIMIKQVF